jgi:broad specificity phosphatase PhoE
VYGEHEVSVVGVSELLLVRHGESEGNLAAAVAHDTGAEEIDVPAPDPDVRLSDLGRRQAQAVGECLRRLDPPHSPDEVACSPYVRARETATRYPEEHARRLWQGKFYHRPAGGESWADVALRLRSWLREVDVSLSGQRVLVVSHDVVIALLRYVCTGLDEHEVLELARTTPVRNAAVCRYVREPDGRWLVTAYDDVEHLRAAGLPVTEHPGERRVDD